jgi:hypothetical protein
VAHPEEEDDTFISRRVPTMSCQMEEGIYKSTSRRHADKAAEDV